MKHIDFNAINSTLRAGLDGYLSKWLPDGVREQDEYVALNPTRADRKRGSFRINLSTGAWSDFALKDAKGGDPLSLYAYLFHGYDNMKAAKELAETMGLESKQPEHKEQERVEVKKKEKFWTQVLPVPDGLVLEDPRHPKFGVPDNIWRYKSKDGQLIGAICRFNTEDGGKEICPLSWCKSRENGNQVWRWQGFDKPRPLYGLEKLALKKPNANVVLVEGEKAADAAQILFPMACVMTWPGGANGVKHADFTPIYGRNTILWPDNDKPGFDAMSDIAEMLGKDVPELRFLMPPEDAPEGWDAADSTWTPSEAQAYAKAHMVRELPMKQTAEGVPLEERIKGEEFAPFRPLGHDRNFYYYMSGGTRTVLTLTLAQHNKAHMLGLAPLQWWEREFGSRDGVQWDAASNSLLRSCERLGWFTMAKIRGRGAWYDEGRVAIHLGDRVLIDGVPHQPDHVKSDFIYEAGLRMRADIEHPLSNKEAVRFAQLCDALPWDKAIYSRFMAGWCVLAHIGGALTWRPHVWVVGPKGSGKTHVMSKVVRPILGDNCLFIQSESTAAGIRQNLAHDALPVLFDEAEGEDQFAVQRLQTVLALVRQSSSDTGGVITKGTPTGKSQTFNVRSCFAFSSINASIIQQSDKSRLTVLELSPDHYKMPLAELERMENDLLTDNYIKCFYARALSLADIIRKNAITFARAVGAEMGEQRAGDQIGALLAGAYSLYSKDIITFDNAVAWVKEQDWAEQRAEIQGQNDEESLLSFIMQQKMRVKMGNGDEEFPIGYLVEVGSGKRSGDEVRVPKERAAEALMRHGIRPDAEWLYISNTSPHIARMLKDTPWSNGWSRVLKRLPDAVASVGTVYYGYRGSDARSIKIPL